MVRLETEMSKRILKQKRRFTFQYGQIRNKKVKISLLKKRKYLHSSMVRLETKKDQLKSIQAVKIYIPVWLDQKPNDTILDLHSKSDLHSSMVRLETYDNDTIEKLKSLFTFQYGQIRNLFFILLATLFLRFTFQYGQIRNLSHQLTHH